MDDPDRDFFYNNNFKPLKNKGSVVNASEE